MTITIILVGGRKEKVRLPKNTTITSDQLKVVMVKAQRRKLGSIMIFN